MEKYVIDISFSGDDNLNFSVYMVIDDKEVPIIFTNDKDCIKDCLYDFILKL